MDFVGDGSVELVPLGLGTSTFVVVFFDLGRKVSEVGL